MVGVALYNTMQVLFGLGLPSVGSDLAWSSSASPGLVQHYAGQSLMCLSHIHLFGLLI